MRIEVKVPQLPESVAEATLVSWHKKIGEAVERDETLVDVETDKVVLELPAPQAGVVVEILKGDGSAVVGSEVVAIIDSEASATVAAAAPASAAVVVPAAAAPAALPAARKMMAEQGLAPAAVDGTGRGGRITKGDVLAATQGAPAAAKPAAPAPVTPGPAPAFSPPAAPGNRPLQRVPMSRLR